MKFLVDARVRLLARFGHFAVDQQADPIQINSIRVDKRK
jgi:hypothetical protein